VSHLLRLLDATQRMGNAAREFLQEHFLPTRHLRDYLTLFTWVLKGEGKHKIMI